MMRYKALPLLVLFLLIPLFGLSAQIQSAPDVLHPGTSHTVVLGSEDDCLINLFLLNEKGEIYLNIAQNALLKEGESEYSFYLQEDAPEGSYTLYLADGQVEYRLPLSIGEKAPSLTVLSAPDAIETGEQWTITLSCEGAASVKVSGDAENEALAFDVTDGENELTLDAPAAPGTYEYTLSAYSAGNAVSMQQSLLLTVTQSETQSASVSKISHISIPSASVTKEDETSYWTMTLGDLSDEEAIWEIMMQPMYVIDLDGRTAREAYKLRATPDKSTAVSNVVGEITYQSQGVHILETLDNGWTLVEAYNSSYGDTYRNENTGKRGYGQTAQLIQGYVETSALKEITPRDDYALLIDKLNQTMYIFQSGHIIGTLLVSTGKVNSTQPWNETPAGEFVIASRTGGFWSGNMFCDMGLLLNGGCLIHQVPSIVNSTTGEHYFGSTEPLLGQKASHGCIRVQRAENENGQNMKWLWDNLKTGTKVLIWEDSTRYQEYPEDDLTLYYNPLGGKKYHTDPNCSSVNSRYLPLTAIKYADLYGEFSHLTPCKTCSAPKHPDTIKAENAANGFDEADEDDTE